MNEPLLNVWVKAAQAGVVECAHCTCMVGLGEVFSHVATYNEALHWIKSYTETPYKWRMSLVIYSIHMAGWDG